MAIDVSCDYDLNADCDKCDKAISECDKVYCETCATGHDPDEPKPLYDESTCYRCDRKFYFNGIAPKYCSRDCELGYTH